MGVTCGGIVGRENIKKTIKLCVRTASQYVSEPEDLFYYSISFNRIILGT